MTEPFSDRAAALEFIAQSQSDRRTATAYLGEMPGLEAELDALAQPWMSTLRVVRAGEETDAPLVGACRIEWDLEVHKAWLQGPWVAPGAPSDAGLSLVQAVLAQVPDEVTSAQMLGFVENMAMAELAQILTWTPTRVNHALTVPAGVVAGWHESAEVRPMAPGDLDTVRAMHDQEFPGSYASAHQLLDDYTTLVVDRDGHVVGYASGQIQADGQAYVDFMVVDPVWRRAGMGRALFTTLARRLLRLGSPDILHLTVDEARPGALAMYLGLGMQIDASLRGYDSPGRNTAEI